MMNDMLSFSEYHHTEMNINNKIDKNDEFH